MSDTEPQAPARPWQVGGALFGLLFLYSSIVNLNDPDGAMWVALYLSGALATGLDVFGRLSRRAAAAMGVLYSLAAVFIGVAATGGSQDMKGFPQVGVFTQELVRESLGLGLVGFWLCCVALRQWRAQR